MSWVCHLPSGKSVVLEDLPITILDRIANEAGMPPGSWYSLPQAPAMNGAAAVLLFLACAERVGDEPPPADYLTARNALEVFTRLEGDDRPIEHEDGLPAGKVDGPAIGS